jgi:hypothetical protein
MSESFSLATSHARSPIFNPSIVIAALFNSMGVDARPLNPYIDSICGSLSIFTGRWRGAAETGTARQIVNGTKPLSERYSKNILILEEYAFLP